MSGTLLLLAFAIGIPVIIGAVAVGYGMAAYNRLIASRNRVREAWRGVEAGLERRAERVADLLETVRSRAADATLETVQEALAQRRAEAGPTPALARAEDGLSAALGGLLAAADPTLGDDAGYRRLLDELAETERELAAARRHYNDMVRRLNVQVEHFPSSIVAGILGIAPADPFELAERAGPEGA